MARRAGGGCCGFGDPRSWGAGDFGTAWGLVGAIIVRDRRAWDGYAPAVVLNFDRFAFYENFSSACLRLGDGRWAGVLHG